jgi:hypothetical protein
MRLGEINRASSRQTGVPAHGAETDSAEPQAAESRALVALAPAAAVPETPANYRQAPFLAQLIATKDQHPQTRERRRAEPAEALAVYRAAAALIGRV